MRKICIVVGSRANYSSIKSVIEAVFKHDNLNLQLVVGASAILEKYGNVSKLIEKDGYKIDAKFQMILEGEGVLSMTKSTGLGIIELSSIFDNLKPDLVVTVGDRYETMSTTIAACYMNISLAHTMGGEVTGTIDESIRHATTKFAHIHFPASNDAAKRIINLGEEPSTVFNYGCPRIDLVSEILKEKFDLKLINDLKSQGVGTDIDFNKDFILVSQHPVTTEFGNGEQQINETLKAVKESKLQAIVLWPNSDAGTGHISKGIRKWRENSKDNNMRFYKNLPIETYVHLMNNTVCLVGNSSSGIREGAFIGTPCVNIGTRQNTRERAENVINTDHSHTNILKSIQTQIKHGKYKSSTIYGDGNAGKNIANVLSKSLPKIQKTITY